MVYIYGNFQKEQLVKTAKSMHNEVHRLLLYKDDKIVDKLFNTDEDFKSYFINLLYRFGGLNTLLGCPVKMVALLSTLQAAYDVVDSDNFEFSTYRKLILDAHGYIDQVFAEGGEDVCRD